MAFTIVASRSDSFIIAALCYFLIHSASLLILFTLPSSIHSPPHNTLFSPSCPLASLNCFLQPTKHLRGPLNLHYKPSLAADILICHSCRIIAFCLQQTLRAHSHYNRSIVLINKIAYTRTHTHTLLLLTPQHLTCPHSVLDDP